MIFDVVWLKVEGWSHIDGFFYQLSSVAGLPNPLNDKDPQQHLIDVVFTLWTFYAYAPVPHYDPMAMRRHVFP